MMKRMLSFAILALLITTPAHAQWQDTSQIEQQIFQQIQHLEQQLNHQGFSIQDLRSGNQYAQQDWRDERLPYYSGNKAAPVLEDTQDEPTYGTACVNRCLSRGKMPNICDDECGMVRDEGVFYDPSYNPRQLAPSQGGAQGFEGVDYECFRQCRLHGDSYDTCNGMCSR